MFLSVIFLLKNGEDTKRLQSSTPRGDKPNGAKARSSEELKFLSSQATLSYRVAVATDANAPRRCCEIFKLA